MDEPTVTVAGHVGGELRRRQVNEHAVADFSLACTPATRERGGGDGWQSGQTQWYRVTAWRRLAEHCTTSLRRGDPVVVHGRLTHRTWTNNNGVEVTDTEIEATFVGHDLRRGTSVFSRSLPSGAGLGPDLGAEPSAPPPDFAHEPSREPAREEVAA
jgi:single-strand DNA-binding protein